jgi:threonine synthase
MVEYDFNTLQKNINSYLLENAKPTVVKYLDFYPFKSRTNLVSLKEGGTPLIHAKKLGKKLKNNQIYIKHEGLNPTGAFKDRGTFVEINKAKEMGFDSVCVASTGNMAASVAAYAAQAGLTCYVFIPENTPKGKLAQSLSYGAKVIQVSGTYIEANALCEKVAQKYHFYLAGDYVFRQEGQKSTAFEIVDQIPHGEVDWVIVPIGMGTHLAGIYKGFYEYHKLGFIKKIPKIVGVQASGCHSIFPDKKGYKVIPVDKPQTICGAIACGDPIDAPKVIDALVNTKGFVLDVTDEESLEAQKMLAQTQALYIEPSSSTTIVAFTKLLKNKVISSDESVVCIATGIGLKDPAATLKIMAAPPTIEPDIKEVERVFNEKLFSMKAGTIKDKERSLFKTVPTAEDLKRTIKTELSLDIDESDFQSIHQEITSFIKNKDKSIGRADLQAITETILQQQSKRRYLQVTDFRLSDSRMGRADIELDLTFNGKKLKSSSDGVGPVDAAVKAIKKIIDENDGIEFKLDDFKVEIPTTGANSTVEVTMILVSKDGTQVVEKGVSPDIIVASIDAYVRGYNELVYQLKERKNS